MAERVRTDEDGNLLVLTPGDFHFDVTDAYADDGRMRQANGALFVLILSVLIGIIWKQINTVSPIYQSEVY